MTTENNAAPSGLTPCAECGMPCEPAEYHPYTACLLFKQTRDAKATRDALNAVYEHARERLGAPKVAEQAGHEPGERSEFERLGREFKSCFAHITPEEALRAINGPASLPRASDAAAPTLQQISDYLHGLDAIQREIVEREARTLPPSPDHFAHARKLAAQPDERTSPRTYTTKPGESVMGIALRECGSEAEWRHILACNPKFAELLPNDYFPVGTVINLPARINRAGGEAC